MKRCSICHTRPAAYHHAFSGDNLCTRCLKKRIVKHIRKAFSIYGFSIPPGERVLLLITPAQAPIADVVAELFLEAERGFTEAVESRVINARGDILSAELQSIREHAAGHNTVMLSTSLEERLLELLTALFRGLRLDACRGVVRLEGVRAIVFKPFTFVSLMDLYAYAAATGQTRGLRDKARPPYTYEALLPVTAMGPELAHSFTKVLAQLTGEVLGRSTAG